MPSEVEEATAAGLARRPEVQEEVPEVDSAPGRRWLRAGVQVALVGLAVYLSWRLLAGLSWSELRGRLVEAHGGLIAVAAALMVVRFVPWDLRWRRAFAYLGEAPPGLIRTFFALLCSACVNLVTPTARIFGGLLRARYVMRDSRHTFGTVYGTVLYDQVAHSVVMGSLSGLALMGFAWSLGQRSLALLVAAVMLAGLGVAARWVVGPDLLAQGPVGRYFRGLAERQSLAGVMRHGREAYLILRALAASRALWRNAVLFGLVYYILNVLGQWVIFLALERPVSLLVVFLAVTLGTAAGIVSGTPGGFGTTEAGMIVAFVALEVARVDAAAATLLYRGLHYLSVLALGLPALVAFELGQRSGKPR